MENAFANPEQGGMLRPPRASLLWGVRVSPASPRSPWERGPTSGTSREEGVRTGTRN